MRREEEKRVNRARLARIGEAAGRDVRDSGVRALLIHTQQSQTETHTHTLRASSLYHQQASATASARRQKRRREDLASLALGFILLSCTLSKPDLAQT